MPSDLEPLWQAMRQASRERAIAEERFAHAREALVSRLWTCYREDGSWEESAVWCAKRMSKRCPYFLELENHKS